MKYPSLFTITFLIWNVATQPLTFAEAEQTTQPAIPYQPFTPVAVHQGGFYPIAGVEDNEPLINIEGRIVSLGKDAAVYFWSNNTYVTPSIDTQKGFSQSGTGTRRSSTRSKFPDPKTGVDFPPNLPNARNRSNNNIYRDRTNPLGEDAENNPYIYWEQITPRGEPLTNAYCVFIHYNERGITELMWRKIKDTRKDKKLALPVPLSSGNRFKKQEEPVYVLLVFQDGEERIPYDRPQRERFLMWHERASMEKMALAYEQSSANQTLDPILIFRPNFLLSEASHNELRGIMVSAFLNITDTGTVSDVYLDNALKPNTSYEITQSMRGWKFLPAIKDGKRVEEEVEIPLQF